MATAALGALPGGTPVLARFDLLPQQVTTVRPSASNYLISNDDFCILKDDFCIKSDEFGGKKPQEGEGEVCWLLSEIEVRLIFDCCSIDFRLFFLLFFLADVDSFLFCDADLRAGNDLHLKR